MKRFRIQLSFMAILAGITFSSLTSKNINVNSRVWFDVTQNYQFAVYGDQQAILDYFSLSTPGYGELIAVGYNESRYGTGPSKDPFVYVTRYGNSIVDAELNLTTQAWLTMDEELFY